MSCNRQRRTYQSRSSPRKHIQPQQTQKCTSIDRSKRVAPITFAAGAGLFGLGLSSGSTLSCALTSILGSCSAGDSNLNKQALLQTVDHVNKMQKRWSQVQDRNNQRPYKWQPRHALENWEWICSYREPSLRYDTDSERSWELYWIR